MAYGILIEEYKISAFSPFTKKLFRRKMSWQEDLDFGNRIQSKVLERIPHDSYRVMLGNFSEFDVILVAEGKATLLEFKSDRIGAKTGNLAIEFLHNKKKSGIDVTHADRWIYTLVDRTSAGETLEIYDIPCAVLREKIYRQEYSNIAGVDGDRTWVYLFNKKLVAQYKLDDNKGTANESG